MKKRPINIEVVEENDQRVVVTINADGEVKRMPVDPTRNPRASHESLTQGRGQKNSTERERNDFNWKV